MPIAVRTETGVKERERVCIGRSEQTREMKMWPVVEFEISKQDGEKEEEG